MKALRLFACLFVSGLSIGAAAPALALANRVFVSQRSGNDANACDNILTPCRTFAGAILQLNPGGEAIVLDSGGYGPVTTTQSVTIEAPPGVLAFIHPPSGTAISVNGSAATVVLRGLTLNGGSGNGINWFGSGTLHIENCVINGFAVRGIVAVPFENSALFLKDTIIRDNANDGVLLQPTGGTLIATIDHCRIDNNHNSGLRLVSSAVTTNVDALIRDTALTANFVGLDLDASGNFVRALVDRCTASNNFGTGMYATGLGAYLRVSGSSITNNVDGLNQVGTSTVETIGNNMVRGNANNKKGTITIQPGD